MYRVIQPEVKVKSQSYVSGRRNLLCSRRRAAWEACSATWNLGTNSASALGPRKSTENLDRVVCPYCLTELVCVLKITNEFCKGKYRGTCSNCVASGTESSEVADALATSSSPLTRFRGGYGRWSTTHGCGLTDSIASNCVSSHLKFEVKWLRETEPSVEGWCMS
jgi:hypothetical protein